MDSDGYCELGWWLTPDASPAAAAAVITAALDTVLAPVAAS